MNLVPREAKASHGPERFRLAFPHDLFGLEDGLDGQEIEPLKGSRSAFTANVVPQRRAKHLVPATKPEYPGSACAGCSDSLGHAAGGEKCEIADGSLGTR